jgi:hypothetical protein
MNVPDAVQRASGAPQSRDPRLTQEESWVPGQQRITTVLRCVRDK